LLTSGKIINRNNVGEKTLNKLAVVGGHALLHRPLQLTEDEITAINLLKILGTEIVHQVDMIMAKTSLVTGLAHKILPEYLGQSVIVVVHAGNPGRLLVRVRTIAKKQSYQWIWASESEALSH
jgi:hypothetical protein